MTMGAHDTHSAKAARARRLNLLPLFNIFSPMPARARLMLLAAALTLGAGAPGVLAQDQARAQEQAGAQKQAGAAPVFGPPAPLAEPPRASPPAAIPPELDRAAAIAAATHPRIAAADAEARALAAEYRGARWLRYPSLNIEALAATEGSNLADSDGLALNLALEQPVWSGGRISGEIARARSLYAAGTDRVAEAARGIVLAVSEAYYDYLLAATRAQVLAQSLAEHERLIGSIERRVTGEVSPRADLTLARARGAQVRLEIAGTEELRAAARARLAALTGGAEIAPEMPRAPITETLPPEELALAEALQCDPALAALADLVAAAEAERRLARRGLLPQVLLQLSQNELTGARAAVVLRARTGNGLAQFSRIDGAQARIERALAQYGEAERAVREDLRRDYALLAAARERIAMGAVAAVDAGAIVQSYQRQFLAGRKSWLEVMNAVREAAAATLVAGDARVAAAAGAARILARTCRWRAAPPATALSNGLSNGPSHKQAAGGR